MTSINDKAVPKPSAPTQSIGSCCRPLSLVRVTSNWYGRKVSKIGIPCFSCNFTAAPSCCHCAFYHRRSAVALSIAAAAIALSLQSCCCGCAFHCHCRHCRHVAVTLPSRHHRTLHCRHCCADHCCYCRCRCAIHCHCCCCHHVAVAPFIASAVASPSCLPLPMPSC
jgi:hypothetical protein